MRAWLRKFRGRREGPTLAQRQIEAFISICEQCARPPRWPGSQDAAPTTSAFFLISAASVAWVDAAAADSRIRLIDVSLEAMATFAAIEASVATGRPQLVIAGAGPGRLGHLWAVPAAQAQGASLLVLVPRTPPHRAGMTDIQEGSTFSPLHQAGADLFDAVIAMDDIAQMPQIVLRLRTLLARPQGAVVQLSVPSHLLGLPCPELPDLPRLEIALPAPSPATTRDVRAELGAGPPPAFLIGSGAVPYGHRLPAILERFGAVHFSTPAAAGLLKDSLGTIGNASGGDIPVRLRELGVRCVIVLGSRLGIASGGGAEGLFPPDSHIIQVDVDQELIAGNAVAMRGRRVTLVQSDIGEFLDAISPQTKELA